MKKDGDVTEDTGAVVKSLLPAKIRNNLKIKINDESKGL